MSEENCIFCKIVRGEMPASIVFEDDVCIAFMDVFPVNEGHSLLIPKKHFINMLDVDDDAVAHLAKRLADLTRRVKKATGEDGVINIVANGEGAGQEIPHLHFHAIPRSKASPFGFHFPPDYRNELASRDSLEEMAKKIRESI